MAHATSMVAKMRVHFLFAAPVSDQNQNDTEHSVRRPIAPSADIAHENLRGAILVMGDPTLNLEIEMKRADQRDCAKDQKQEEAHPTLLCHSKISRLSFTWRYL